MNKALNDNGKKKASGVIMLEKNVFFFLNFHGNKPANWTRSITFHTNSCGKLLKVHQQLEKNKPFDLFF